jgi:hypothetical protein
MAVLALREALACIRQGGAAAVETVGVMVCGLVIGPDVSGSFFAAVGNWDRMYLFAMVADPFWDND